MSIIDPTMANSSFLTLELTAAKKRIAEMELVLEAQRKMWPIIIRHAADNPAQIELIGRPGQPDPVRDAVLYLYRKVYTRCCEIADAVVDGTGVDGGYSDGAAAVRDRLAEDLATVMPQ